MATLNFPRKPPYFVRGVPSLPCVMTEGKLKIQPGNWVYQKIMRPHTNGAFVRWENHQQRNAGSSV